MGSSDLNDELQIAGINDQHPTQIGNQNRMNIRAYDSLDEPANMPESAKHRAFIPLVIVAQVFGVACVIQSIIWGALFNDGFGWSNPETVFNYHPVFMILGLIFCYGDAMLLYRVFPMFPKLPVKAVHAVLMLLSLLFSVVGLKAVFDSHNMRDIPNMYSIHSWVGIIIVSIFALQWVIGLVTFLIPSVPKRIRAKVLPVHKAMGIFMFLGALVACISGITEKNFFKGKPAEYAITAGDGRDKNYSKFPTAAQISNVLGLCLVIFCGLVFYLVHRSDYKRVEGTNTEQANIVSLN